MRNTRRSGSPRRAESSARSSACSGIWRRTSTGYSDGVSTTLALLCTRAGTLPQGACTSPVLANLAVCALEGRIDKWCRYRGITYTRYSDDLSFSADEMDAAAHPGLFRGLPPRAGRGKPAARRRNGAKPHTDSGRRAERAQASAVAARAAGARACSMVPFSKLHFLPPKTSGSLTASLRGLR